MARYPDAMWKPLPENSTQAKIVPTQFIAHTAVDAPGATKLFDYFDNPGVGVESHFWIPNKGRIVQGMDTEVQADANYKGNVRAISAETEDDGDPEANPWTKFQISSLIELGIWAVKEHNIPPILAPAWDKPGFGWHSMWGFSDPIRQIGPITSPWTKAMGKTCPGKVRAWQFRTKVMPEIAASFSTKSIDNKFGTEIVDQVVAELIRRLQD